MRPRLLRSLTERWRHRVTYLTGGPGLGKTTLLAQAIAENRLAPRGEDVWIAVESSDADSDHLAHVVATALARTDADADRPAVTMAAPIVVEPATVAAGTDRTGRRSSIPISAASASKPCSPS